MLIHVCSFVILFHYVKSDIDWSHVAETTTFKASMATGYNYYEKFRRYSKTAESSESRICWTTFLDELPDLCGKSKVDNTLFEKSDDRIFSSEICCCSTDLLFRCEHGEKC